MNDIDKIVFLAETFQKIDHLQQITDLSEHLLLKHKKQFYLHSTILIVILIFILIVFLS